MSGVETSPGVDNRQNLWYTKIGERDIVRGRERNDITFPRDGFSLQEQGGETCSDEIHEYQERLRHTLPSLPDDW